MTIGSEGSSYTKAFTGFIYAKASSRKGKSIMSEMNANTELSLLPSLPFWTVLSSDMEPVVLCICSATWFA